MWTAEEAAKRSQYYQHETAYSFIRRQFVQVSDNMFFLRKCSTL